MARFELDDGVLRRFWEVELDGEALRFRSGALGTPGRCTTRRYGCERAARATWDQAVRAMVDQGYAQVFAAPARPIAGLPGLGALREDPDDPVALAVHADALLAAGDPRGERIALELAAARGPGTELPPWSASDCDPDVWPGEIELSWRWGYVKALRLRARLAHGTDPAGEAVSLLSGPSFRLLRRLHLAVPSAERVVLACELPALRELSLRSGGHAGPRWGDEGLDLDRLAEVAPRLRQLAVHTSTRPVGERALAGLQSLGLGAGPGWVELLLRARPADLRALRCEGLDGTAARALAAAGVFAGLRTLTLKLGWRSPIDELLRAIEPGLGAPLHLRLIGGTVDAQAARRLTQLPLRALTVNGVVGAEVEAILGAASFPVDGRRDPPPDPAPAADAVQVRPPDLPVARFEVVERDARRFWEIGVAGAVHHVRAGRVGTPGVWRAVRFPSEDVAEEIRERRIEEKLREGYLAERCP